MKKKFFGFTLGEVLITLGIIGLIAVLTLPTLSYHINKQRYAATLKRFYSDISNAIENYMTDNNVDDLRDSDLETDSNATKADIDEAQKAVNSFIEKYMKVTKTCEPADYKDCFADKYTNLSGGDITKDLIPYYINKTKSYVLPYGATFIISSSGYGYPPDIWVDVNGKKGPNTAGYDLWYMSIYSDGSIGENKAEGGGHFSSYNGNNVSQRAFNACKTGQYGEGCFTHFMDYDFKFDY